MMKGLATPVHGALRLGLGALRLGLGALSLGRRLGARLTPLLAAGLGALALLVIAREAGGLELRGAAAALVAAYERGAEAALGPADAWAWARVLEINAAQGLALSLDPFWRHVFVIGLLLALGDACRLARARGERARGERRRGWLAAAAHLALGAPLAAAAALGLGIAAAAPPAPIPHYLAAALPLAALFLYVGFSLAWIALSAPRAASRGFHWAAALLVLGLTGAAAGILLGRLGLRYPGVAMLAAMGLLAAAALAATRVSRRASARAAGAGGAALLAAAIAALLAGLEHAPQAMAAMAAAWSP
ncbi:MAG: hypothetical protein AAGM38_05655 [Pseudomonadota bacterium]